MRIPILLAAATALALLSPVAAVAADPEPDTLPPVITLTPPAGGANNWYGGSSIHVQVRATEDRAGDSGVGEVTYALNGGHTRVGSIPAGGGPVEVSSTGRTTVTVTATDLAGNVATASVLVGLDRGRPVVSYQGRVVPGAVFVQGEEVPLLYTCRDEESGVASCVGPVPSGGLLDTGTLDDNRTVRVTATDRVGLELTHVVHYRVVEPEFDVVGAVEVEGTPQVGHDLTGGAPEFSPTPAAIGYRWHRDGVPIGDATTLAYRVRAADAGHRLTLVATATRPAFNAGTSTSTPVTILPGELVLSADPVLSGDARVGETLEVEHPPVFPGGATETYVWLRGDAPIPGASERAYELRAADAGHRVRVVLTATRDGYLDRSWVTEPSAVVAGGPPPDGDPLPGGGPLPADGAPRIVGAARVGGTLQAMLPSYQSTGGTPVSTAVNWLRDGQEVPGATGTTYRLRAPDVGRRLSVRVTATAAGHAPSVLVGAATGPVAKAAARLRAKAVRARGRAVRLTVTVSAPGVLATGPVIVRAGRRVVARGVLRGGTVRLTARLSKRVSRLGVTYAGDAGVVGRSGTVRISAASRAPSR
ncbi:hypothetical protein [Nocardioides sp. W7]|uniref:hypothetical protein n=1 Tax=Nocardioides sp. W7 TaxID=2931390 RepID=UPI001FD2CB77|nr:hypothetical protein [Nocardioides sp. W7]